MLRNLVDVLTCAFLFAALWIAWDYAHRPAGPVMSGAACVERCKPLPVVSLTNVCTCGGTTVPRHRSGR
jgi:hypothetical protein